VPTTEPTFRKEAIAGGEGLGLFEARRHVKDIGGSIDMEVSATQTTFHVRIKDWKYLEATNGFGSIFYNRKNSFLRFLGRPLAVAPFWETVFHSITQLGVVLGWNWLIIGAVVIVSSLAFGFSHWGRSPPNGRAKFIAWLSFVGFVLNLAVLSPLLYLDYLSGHTTSFFLYGFFTNSSLHALYNFAVLRGWLPKWMGLASSFGSESGEDASPAKKSGLIIVFPGSRLEMDLKDTALFPFEITVGNTKWKLSLGENGSTLVFEPMEGFVAEPRIVDIGNLRSSMNMHSGFVVEVDNTMGKLFFTNSDNIRFL
jgi:hypothetical protein